ncbi:MAG: dihydroorotase [bacterium]|nr:dihydroorotase [bacterium]
MADTVTVDKGVETHVHGREGLLLKTVVPMTARQCSVAIFEPNLSTPITTRSHARGYRHEIEDVTSAYPNFTPYILAYLTDTIDPDELAQGCSDGDFIGLKFYPQGATTNSDSGVVDVRTLWTPGTQQFNAVQAVHSSGKVVQLHCEVNYDLAGNELDPYDKEGYFFAEIMPRLLDAHTGKFSAEHLTTEEGVQFMYKHGGPRLGCSITPHHLLCDRRDMFRGGLRPHLFCLPVIKRSRHREALINLAFGSYAMPFVYAGSDSAPHDRRKKESDCCSGGVFSAHAAMELYLEAFKQNGVTNEYIYHRFLARNARSFYGLPASDDSITFVHDPWTVDEMIHYSDDPADVIRPFGYENNPKDRKSIQWKLQS